MKTKHFLIGGLATLSLIMVSSCTDSSYDLDNVDTTARFKANDLIVPINLDTLTFDQVLDIDENDPDRIIFKEQDSKGNWFYYVKKNGDFHSDPIEVNKFTAAYTPQSTTEVIGSPVVIGGFTEYAIIGVTPTPFTVTATGIDESIISIDKLGVNSTLKTNLSVTGVSSYTIKGLILQLPAGIEGTPSKGKFYKTGDTYKGATLTDYSVLDLDETGEVVSKGEVLTLDIINYYSVKKTGGIPNIDFDPTAHTLEIEDQIKIQAGTIEVATTSAPPTVSFTITPAMDDLVVETFSGDINYKVEDFNIDPIELNNLPDFLNQEGTKMGIVNPQIFLKLNNPVGDYAKLESGFKMTPERDEIKGTPATLDVWDGTKWVPNQNGIMTVNKKDTKDQFFVLAPEPDKAHESTDYPNPTPIHYTGLRSILDTPTKEPGVNGIPTKIYVETVEPQVPKQSVVDFKLGKKYGKVDETTSEVKYGVDGKYMFYAPLQLTNGTQINYNDTIDGWNDEDVDKLNITALQLNMTVSTEVSFPIDLTIIPITFDAKPIPGVSANTVTIPAEANGFDFKVVFNGNITHLDGLLLKAKVLNKDDQTTLSPTMKIIMKNSKAILTGYYEKEL